jgi:hypothetical protein
MFHKENGDDYFRSMVEMAESLFGDDVEELSSQDERKDGGYREYVTYPNEEKAKAAFQSGGPISVILGFEDTIVVVKILDKVDETLELLQDRSRGGA